MTGCHSLLINEKKIIKISSATGIVVNFVSGDPSVGAVVGFGAPVGVGVDILSNSPCCQKSTCESIFSDKKFFILNSSSFRPRL